MKGCVIWPLVIGVVDRRQSEAKSHETETMFWMIGYCRASPHSPGPGILFIKLVFRSLVRLLVYSLVCSLVWYGSHNLSAKGKEDKEARRAYS